MRFLDLSLPGRLLAMQHGYAEAEPLLLRFSPSRIAAALFSALLALRSRAALQIGMLVLRHQLTLVRPSQAAGLLDADSNRRGVVSRVVIGPVEGHLTCRGHRPRRVERHPYGYDHGLTAG